MPRPTVHVGRGVVPPATVPYRYGPQDDDQYRRRARQLSALGTFILTSDPTDMSQLDARLHLTRYEKGGNITHSERLQNRVNTQDVGVPQ